MSTRPYGSWSSPISPQLLVAGAVGLSEVRADGDDLWWSEARPEQAGRVQIVRRCPDGSTTDVLPDGFAARTRVHEYGGGAWTVHDGVLYFSNWEDQRLYRLDEGGQPEALTADGRYADARIGPDGTWLAVVRETHGDSEAVNEIVAVATDGSDERVLVTGPDFVSSPRPASDGRLAWLQWDHPDMPWDAAELVVDGQHVAGGDGESVFQPEWAPDGSLWFTSDRTGWSELYRWADGGIEQMTHLDAEIGVPQWVFGLSRYALLDDGRPVFAVLKDGLDHLPGDDRYTDVGSVVRAPGGIAAVVASPTVEPTVVAGPPDDLQVVRPPRDLGLAAGAISVPEPIDFPSAGGRTAHALYYPPTNTEHEAPDGDRPPLLVEIHGGPTAAARSRLQVGVQFWTSRGFAVVDVNYGGSTGYGRSYRELLRGQWGVVDVEDCVAAARFLAEDGRADPERLAIRGGSAGGFTTLAALAFHDTFAAGVNKFGVADLAVLAQETHKFESRYLDGLIGPWPEAEATYRERSPLFHADAIDRPLLVLQGLEDEVVPPNQSELIVDALRANGIPVAYLAFEGEQHGFRRADTITRAAEAELSFYGQVFGFEPAGDIEPVVIENW